MNHPNEFDDVLNEALREYREAEPLAGIEDRVLRRLQSHVARRPRFGWRWRMVAATLAVIVMLVWIGVRHAYQQRWSAPQLVQQKTPAAPVSSEMAVIPGDETRRTPQQPRGRRDAKTKMQQHPTLAASRPVPVRGEFPAPAPLDREERALLALARVDPEAVRPLARDENNSIDIAPITIQPLQNGSGAEGED